MEEYVIVKIERKENGMIATDMYINMKIDALMVTIANLVAQTEDTLPVERRAKFRADLLKQMAESRKELCNEW